VAHNLSKLAQNLRMLIGTNENMTLAVASPVRKSGKFHGSGNSWRHQAGESRQRNKDD
jgi:hypothetical protein